MASSGDSKLVIFAGGIAIGGALAIGTAYLVSRQLTERDDDLAVGRDAEEQRKPRRPGKSTHRRQSKYRETSPRCAELDRSSNGGVAIPQRKQTAGPSMARDGSVGRESVFARAGLDNQDPYHRTTMGSPCAAGFFDNAAQNLHPFPRAPSPNVLGDIPMSPSARRMQEEESDFDRFDDGPNPYNSDMGDTVQGHSDSECNTRARSSAPNNIYDSQGRGPSGPKQNMQTLQQQHSSMPMIGPSDRGGNRVALSVLTHQLSPRAGHPIPFNQFSVNGQDASGSAAPTHSTHQFPANPRGGAAFIPTPPRAPSPMPVSAPSNHTPSTIGASPYVHLGPQQPAHGTGPAGAGGAPAAQSANKPESLFTHIVNQGKIIEDMAMNDQYSRVLTPETQPTEEQEESCAYLKECLDMRDKWLWRDAVPAESVPSPEAACISDIRPDPLKYEPGEKSPMDFGMVNGVMHVWTDETREQVAVAPPGTAYQFFSDMHRMLKIGAMGPVKTLCHHRLELLEQKFNLHCMLNADKEFLAQKVAPHRDFYNVRKVDTHIHHSACMHQKHLLRFIKSKLKKEPDEVVIFRDGKYLTLKEVFESLNLTAYDLNVDTLDMHADKNIFHRFDKFNLKYNPCGQSRLREIFIKSDNLIHGRFLAELTQEVMSDLELSKYQHAEWRISIYGRKPVEWDLLASWVCSNRLFSDNMIWLIQLPRLYNVYKSTGIIDNFQQMLDNIFQPLFEVTADPASHPQLHIFLSHVVGFDCVDDESKPERRPNKRMRPPQDWDLQHNPAFSYYAYYIYANLFTLNKFRESRGFNTFTFRPHCGEAGDIDHLVSCFMLAENIAHGINLRKSPSMQYLYYLAQIGLCMSPLSNNSLFLDYHRNPFPIFFARGLNVSLSTDDPLQIHLTREPLVEEYSVAAQVWKLSAADLCEIARNSVIQSGFPHTVKMHWVGERYYRMGPDGNDIQKTNVPNLRIRFRTDVYQEDLRFILGSWRLYQERMAAKAEGQ